MYLSRNLAEKRKVTCPDSARPHETGLLPDEKTLGFTNLPNNKLIENTMNIVDMATPVFFL
jgi:hypothetical protein